MASYHKNVVIRIATKILSFVQCFNSVRVEVETRLGVILFHRMGDEFIAKSQIEGQLPAHFEIILHVPEHSGLLENIVDDGADRRAAAAVVREA